MTYKSLIAIVILLVAGLIFWQVGCNKPPQKVQKEPTAIYNKTIDSLKTLIADQAILQQGYTAQINELNDSIIVLNGIIEKNTLTLKQIKQRRNEQKTILPLSFPLAYCSITENAAIRIRLRYKRGEI